MCWLSSNSIQDATRCYVNKLDFIHIVTRIHNILKMHNPVAKFKESDREKKITVSKQQAGAYANHKHFWPRIKTTITKTKRKINHQYLQKADIVNNTDKLLDLLD